MEGNETRSLKACDGQPGDLNWISRVRFVSKTGNRKQASLEKKAPSQLEAGLRRVAWAEAEG